jgi:hypothetical protein
MKSLCDSLRRSVASLLHSPLRSLVPASVRLPALLLLLAPLLPDSASAEVASYVNRPVYSEPGVGLQLPPGCTVDAAWRSRLPNTDLEVWVAECQGVVRTWLVRRAVVEVLASNQARLRFQVLDERQWPGEVAGDTASVQCVGRGGQEAGYVVLGAKWRPAAANSNELRLVGAGAVIRADAASARFTAATLGQVECSRYPDREAMLKRLQQSNR